MKTSITLSQILYETMKPFKFVLDVESSTCHIKNTDTYIEYEDDVTISCYAPAFAAHRFFDGYLKSASAKKKKLGVVLLNAEIYISNENDATSYAYSCKRTKLGDKVTRLEDSEDDRETILDLANAHSLDTSDDDSTALVRHRLDMMMLIIPWSKEQLLDVAERLEIEAEASWKIKIIRSSLCQEYITQEEMDHLFRPREVEEEVEEVEEDEVEEKTEILLSLTNEIATLKTKLEDWPEIMVKRDRIHVIEKKKLAEQYEAKAVAQALECITLQGALVEEKKHLEEMERAWDREGRAFHSEIDLLRASLEKSRRDLHRIIAIVFLALLLRCFLWMELSIFWIFDPSDLLVLMRDFENGVYSTASKLSGMAC